MPARPAQADLHCPRCDARLVEVGAARTMTTCPACHQDLLAVDVAPWPHRVAAAAIDLACVGLTAGPLHLGVRALLDRDDPPVATGLDAVLSFGAQDLTTILFECLPLLIFAGLYYGLFVSLTGRTPGMSAVGIRVVATDGRVPHPIAAAVRYVASVMGLMPATLGFWWLLVDVDRRAMHDHASRTYVVRDS
ncbi:MAG: RDD family protein [Myxococcales bacterium FL481]|nr:MAG: RDD family protein [Myxococcales bacterium FL481]